MTELDHDGYTPRADPDAERLVIAAALTGQPIEPLARIVAPGDFREPRHEAIWQAMLDVTHGGGTIDIASVRATLDRHAARIDPVYLADLYGQASLTATGEWHAHRISELAQLRRLATALTQGLTAVHNPAIDLAAARDIARTELDSALGGGDTRSLTRIREVLPEVIDIAETGNAPALSTPWPDLDRLIGGIAPGRLVVIGARPGHGKSLAGTNLALHTAHPHGHAALIASIEMPRQEVVQRLVAAHAGVNINGLINARVAEPEWEKIGRHFDTINDLPIYIEDGSEQSVTSIRAAAKEVLRDRADLALVVVDYLQLMSTPDAGRSSSRAERLGAVTRGLKVLARETNTCVVAMAQVNREGVKHGNRPTMGDLRESGSIESDADQVILLHRPDDEIPEIEVLVDKNRWGPKGRADLQLVGHHARLASTTRPWEGPR